MMTDRGVGLQVDAERVVLRSRPNCSLSERACKSVFWSVAGVTFLISAVFSYLGYWLILPFAGLEIGVLAWAFEQINGHRHDYELLEIRGDEIRLESRQGSETRSMLFNRQWVQLVKHKSPPGGHVRIALRSYGAEYEIGLFMDDDKRQELAGLLRNWLRMTS